MELQACLMSTYQLPKGKDGLLSLICSLPFGETEKKRLVGINNETYLRCSLCGALALNELTNILSFPYALNIIRTKLGKPIFEDTFLPQFSISHSEPLSIAVISDTRNVGVGIDIEFVRPDINIHKIAKRFFTKNEYDGFKEQEYPESFFLTWTRKEAMGKLLGTGLISDTKNEKDSLFFKSYHIVFNGKEAYLTVCCDTKPQKINITHNIKELTVDEIQN